MKIALKWILLRSLGVVVGVGAVGSAALSVIENDYSDWWRGVVVPVCLALFGLRVLFYSATGYERFRDWKGRPKHESGEGP